MATWTGPSGPAAKKSIIQYRGIRAPRGSHVGPVREFRATGDTLAVGTIEHRLHESRSRPLPLGIRSQAEYDEVVAVMTSPSLLDEFLTNHDFSERHERFVAAARASSYEAVKSVTLGEMPLTRVLFIVRSGAAPLVRRRALPAVKSEPLLAQMLAFGFTQLAEDPSHEFVAGLIGQFWKPSGRITVLRDARDFVDFHRPGFVKAAMNLRVLDEEHGSRMETETRVLATDPKSRRAFTFYWGLVRLGSGAIRREWLRAAAYRAESA